MPELIDRYATMGAIPSPTDADEAEYYGKVCDAIEAMPTIEPEVRRWIPCLKRLPEPLQSVIVCTDIRTVTLAWLNGDHWVFADTGNGHTEKWGFDAVTHWMPLPSTEGLT